MYIISAQQQIDAATAQPSHDCGLVVHRISRLQVVIAILLATSIRPFYLFAAR